MTVTALVSVLVRLSPCVTVNVCDRVFVTVGVLEESIVSEYVAENDDERMIDGVWEELLLKPPGEIDAVALSLSVMDQVADPEVVRE